MPIQVVISELECLRCDHKWYPRKPGLPATCPNCRSPYWNRPRRNQASQPTARTPSGDNG